jgi:hypothetical protein
VVSSVSTIKAAVELKQTFDQMAAAEKLGSLSPDEKRKLEEAAAEKVRESRACYFLRRIDYLISVVVQGIQALFKVLFLLSISRLTFC